jgi:adenylate cyclase
MTSPGSHDTRDEAFWRDFLDHPDTLLAHGRHILQRIPSNPRCRLCAAPFEGPGGRVMRLIGKRRSDANPTVCNSCANVLLRHHGGAEVDCSMLFADIRGSTALAETISPGQFHALLDRFYTVASEAVFAFDGIVDKFVGDELVAAFPPMMSEVPHAIRAVQAGRQLLTATGHADSAGPWVPLGAGVHSGRVWFGATGEGDHVELTIVGDAVNTTARLAALAAVGEILVSADAAAAAALPASLERRTATLKGKAQPVEIVAIQIERS